MSLVSRLERWLEEGIEGLFRHRAASVQPVEIGRRLWRLMEEQKQVSVSRTYVPNVFRVSLSPSDHARLADLAPRLSEELCAHLEQLAGRQGYAVVGPLRLEWTEGDLPPGSFRVEAAFARGAEGEPEPATAGSAPRMDTLVFRRPAAQAARPADGERRPAGGPRVVVKRGPDAGRSFCLRPGENRVGRAEDNDLVLSDTNVSRHHAILVWRDGAVRLRDLGSRNGTRLHGELIEEAEVAEGEEFQVGLDVLAWGEERS